MHEQRCAARPLSQLLLREKGDYRPQPPPPGAARRAGACPRELSGASGFLSRAVAVQVDPFETKL
jgi:hypothetical protein